MTTLEIVEKMLMLGINPDWINAVYNKGKEDAVEERDKSD